MDPKIERRPARINLVRVIMAINQALPPLMPICSDTICRGRKGHHFRARREIVREVRQQSPAWGIEETTE